jgi:hypothetical protein
MAKHARAADGRRMLAFSASAGPDLGAIDKRSVSISVAAQCHASERKDELASLCQWLAL